MYLPVLRIAVIIRISAYLKQSAFQKEEQYNPLHAVFVVAGRGICRLIFWKKKISKSISTKSTED